MLLGATSRLKHYAIFVVDRTGTTSGGLSQRLSTTRCGLAIDLSISFVSTPSFKTPKRSAELEGPPYELSCADIYGRGSTAHSGAQCSREQLLVHRIAWGRHTSRSPAPRRVRSDLALWSAASSTPRLGRGRPSQSRQRRRRASRPRRRAVVPGRRFFPTRQSSDRVGWRRRSLKNRTSTPRRSIARFGSATPMATLWLSPVPTAKTLLAHS